MCRRDHGLTQAGQYPVNLEYISNPLIKNHLAGFNLAKKAGHGQAQSIRSWELRLARLHNDND
jgi:hypothetical protein